MIYNTGETSEELESNYNPEGSQLRLVQNRLLEMLIYLDDICNKLNIKYSISYGNVLGAVRHGGFIPWDDDIDVIMSRRNATILSKFLLSHPHPRFVLQTHITDPGFWGCWPVLRDVNSEYLQNDIVHTSRKFRGLQIDIFPFEEMSSKKIHLFASLIYSKMIVSLVGKNDTFLTINDFLLRFIIFPCLRAIAKVFRKKGYCMPPLGSIWVDSFLHGDVFPTVPLLFEKHYFQGPRNCEAYLTNIYGNYMELPPIESRNKHHTKYKIW